MKLKERVAIITGAASGIGSAFITGALIPIDGGYSAFKGAKHRVTLSK